MTINHSNLERRVLNRIRERKIVPHSRVYFAVRRVLLFAAFVGLALYVVFHLSFLLYSIRRTGTLYLPSFGSQGIILFLGSFPWLLGLIGLVLTLLLGLLIGRTTGAYRWPVVTSLLATLGLVGIGASVVFVTPFHTTIHRTAVHQHLPVIESAYRTFAGHAAEPDQTYIGIATAITKKGFTLTNRRGHRFYVQLNVSTRLLKNRVIHDRDAVLIIGELKKGTIEADAIRLLPERDRQEILRHLTDIRKLP